MNVKEVALAMACASIKKWEGCRLTSYLCPAGVWTIGYGETRGIRKGDVWSQERAEMALERAVAEFMESVIKACPKLAVEAPNRLAACVSLAYNIGLTAFAKSTVCKKITEGKFAEAADAFLMWNKANGQVLNGLVRRRTDERNLFIGV